MQAEGVDGRGDDVGVRRRGDAPRAAVAAIRRTASGAPGITGDGSRPIARDHARRRSRRSISSRIDVARSRRSRIVDAQPAELAPITAWLVVVGPRPAVRARERDPDVVPPGLAVDEDAVEVEQDGVERPGAVTRPPPVPSIARKTSIANPATPSASAPLPRRTRFSSWNEATCMPPAAVSTDSSPTWMRPPRDLRARPRSLAGHVDPHVARHEPGRRRRQEHPADRRVVAPRQPAAGSSPAPRATRAGVTTASTRGATAASSRGAAVYSLSRMDPP